jgi:hypothetical protein
VREVTRSRERRVPSNRILEKVLDTDRGSLCLRLIFSARVSSARPSHHL